MEIKSLCFLFSILLFSSLCHGNDKTVIEVVGHGDCADCSESKVKYSQAFSGLRVTIDCMAPNGEVKTRGEGKLDDEGKFVVTLPSEILENEKLQEECFAKLHSASHSHCPTHNGVVSSKLIFKANINGKHTFTTYQKLKFSSTTCTSKTFLPHFTYPPLPKWKKHFPITYPPLPKWKKHFPFYKKPCPPLAPIIKKPFPPPVPIYKPTPKPNPPVYKPTPKPPVYKSPPYVKPIPPVPIYKPKPKPNPPVYKPKPNPPVYEPKPKPPVYEPPPYLKPLPPPVPIYKKPFPPSIPIYKPLPPMYKTFPPFPTIPKKPPCPPLPKLPKYPKIPPKYFHHPIFAPWPPQSP